MAGNKRSNRGQNLSNEDRSRGGQTSSSQQDMSELGRKGGEAQSNQSNSDNNQ